MKKYIIIILSVFLLIGCSGNNSVLVKNVTKETIWNELIRSCGMGGFPITYQDFETGEMRIDAGMRSEAVINNYSNKVVAYSTQQGVQVYVKQQGSDVVIISIMQGDDGFGSAWPPVDGFINQLAGKYELVRGYSEELVEPTYLTKKTSEEIMEIIDKEL